MPRVNFRIRPVIEELISVQSKRLREAAGVVKDALIIKELQLFGTQGNLQKGTVIGYDGQDRDNLNYVKVGFAAPAQHAHLLEFGTRVRTVKNYRGHRGKSQTSGAVPATHFTAKTFMEQYEPVKELLSERWL